MIDAVRETIKGIVSFQLTSSHVFMITAVPKKLSGICPFFLVLFDSKYPSMPIQGSAAVVVKE